MFLLPAIASLAFLWLLRTLFTSLSNPLSRIPAVHWSAAFSRWHILYNTYFDERRYALYRAHVKSDGQKNQIFPVIRVGPNQVSVMSPKAVQSVYGEGWAKTDHYKNFHNFSGTPNMFSLLDRKPHDERKRVVSPGFSRSTVYSSRMQQVVKSRVQKLTSFIASQTGTPLDGDPLIARNIFRALSIDIMMVVLFCEELTTTYLDKLRPGANSLPDLGMEDLELWCEDTREAFFFFAREPEFQWLSRFLPHKADLKQEKFEKFIVRLCNKFEELASGQEEKEGPLWAGTYGRLLRWKYPNTGLGLNWHERASEVMDLTGAGFDSVACTLEAMMQHLSENPRYQYRLNEELRNNLPNDPQQRTYDIIDNLPFLNAVTMESLRLVDSIETSQPRLVPVGGCTLEGHFIPEGTIISSHPYLMNRHPDHFPNPHAFKPERWLEGPKSYSQLHRQLFTFSKGLYSCCGREIALAIIKIATAELFLQFNVSALVKDQKWWKQEEEALKSEIVFRRWEYHLPPPSPVGRVMSF